MPAYLARTGLAVFAMLFGITLLTEHVAAGRPPAAAIDAIELPPLREIVPTRMDGVTAPVAVAGFELAAPRTRAAPDARAVSPAAAAPAAEVAPPPARTPVSAPATVAADGIVVASWYGPGFYGNRTACGQLYTPELLGVAHLTLPCGTLLTLTYGGRVLTVTVIDRGPYIAGRAIDLSNATRAALGCTDLCTLRMHVGP